MKRILFLLWLAASPLMAAGQSYDNAAVEISAEKANIGGKVYFIHKVLARQTVFSICKAYGITVEELTAANPDLRNGLKAGSILFIPEEAAKNIQPAPAKDSTGIRKTDGPAEAEAAVQEDTDGKYGKDSVFRVEEHRVRWYESIKSISRKYGVPVSEIIDYNGLDSQQLTSGMVLLIPIRGILDSGSGEDGLPAEETIGNESESAPEAPVAPARRHRWFSADDPIDIALILPLNAGSASPSQQFLNFYSGALMAVEEQKQLGAHVVLNVYDLSQGAAAILADSKFSDTDLIIGPVEAATMAPFVEYSDRNGIPLVSPLDHKADSIALDHPFFYQVPVSAKIQACKLADNLRFNPRDKVILVYSETTGESDFISRIENALMASDVSYRKTGLSGLPGLVTSLSRNDNPAKIIIASENKVFSSDVIRSLNTTAKKHVPMKVFFTNRVRNYETSDPDALFNISAHVPAPYFVDYTNEEDQKFVLGYRAMFAAEPDDFAFQGHDVLAYFIAAMTKLGTAVCDNADSYPMQLLHCNFHFRRENEKSGWYNHATRNIVYNREDFSITLSK